METRFINTKDGNGFILEGSNGMRLSAMQYWMCSEKGVEFDSISDPPVQLIFAEPLPNAGNYHVHTCVHVCTCTHVHTLGLGRR